MGVLEQSLLRRFKEGARPYLSIAPKDDIEWLILARHHGLPTRVMDWSKILWLPFTLPLMVTTLKAQQCGKQCCGEQL